MKAAKILFPALLAVVIGSGMLFSGKGTSMASGKTLAEAADLSAHLIQDTEARYGEDSAMCVRNWSLYAEYYRQRNYEMAYEPWKYMFESCPKATVNIYIHGANMIKHFYNEETDPEKRDQWVDTLMMVYERRIEMFGEEGRVLGRKAADLYQYRPDDVQELLDLTERSIELQGMDAGADVLVINFQSTIRLVQAGMKEPGEIIERFDRATDIIEYNFEHNPEDERFFRPAKNHIRSMFEPYATCEALVQVFEPRFEENPEDIELLERITEMMDNADCVEEELYFLATEKLHELQPNAESAFLMGRLHSTRGEYETALTYFQDAIERFREDDPEANRNRIFRSYWQMAEIAYRRLERMPQARRYAREAHQVNPNDGRPLIIIGEMYAASTDRCGDDDFTRLTVYWPAVDKFEQAANVAEDPAVEERARQLARTYRQYFPDREDIFFHGYSEGDSYRVECWINRNTVIRAR